MPRAKKEVTEDQAEAEKLNQLEFSAQIIQQMSFTVNRCLTVVAKNFYLVKYYKTSDFC